MSDFWPHGAAADRYGVLRAEGYAERAIFLIDKHGIIQYIDVHDIDEQPDNEVLFKELDRLEPEARQKIAETTAEPTDELPHGGIIIYCTPWCPDCRKARQWLKECGLAYTEVDVSRNQKAADQVRRWSGGTLVTPTFDIDGTIVIDYDQKVLAEVLHL